MTGPTDAGRSILEEGRFCYLSATTDHGPHVTPVVFVLDRGSVWASTGRSTAKARAWKADPTAAGLVQQGGRAVVFRGRVSAYDVLDPKTWPSAIGRVPDLMRAAARFTLKNARYFAGYARDVRRLPVSWMPQARVMISVEVEAGVVLEVEGGTVEERWGRWGNRAVGLTAFRAARGSHLREHGVFREVRQTLGPSGKGTLGVVGSAGPIVLPVSWVRSASEGVYYAVLPRRFLSLAGVNSHARAALVVDRTSPWRAARMRGVLLQGDAQLFVPGGMRSGREALLKRAGRIGPLPPDPAVVRIRPSRAVWWKGWVSGTVGGG